MWAITLNIVKEISVSGFYMVATISLKWYTGNNNITTKAPAERFKRMKKQEIDIIKRESAISDDENMLSVITKDCKKEACL